MTREYTYEEALAIAEKRKEYRKKYYETHTELMAEYRKARYDAIKNALAKGPSQTPKEEVVIEEAPDSTTVVNQKRSRKKKETVTENKEE
jgi:hypothetical protein